jgi:hypothetical protein
LAVLQAWLSGWNKSDIFSDAAVRHLSPTLFVSLSSYWATSHAASCSDAGSMWNSGFLYLAAGCPSSSSGKSASFLQCSSARLRRTPPIGQLWYQTGVKSETVPRLERVQRWVAQCGWLPGICSTIRAYEAGQAGVRFPGTARWGACANSSIPTMDRPGERVVASWVDLRFPPVERR